MARNELLQVRHQLAATARLKKSGYMLLHRIQPELFQSDALIAEPTVHLDVRHDLAAPQLKRSAEQVRRRGRVTNAGRIIHKTLETEGVHTLWRHR